MVSNLSEDDTESKAAKAAWKANMEAEGTVRKDLDAGRKVHFCKGLMPPVSGVNTAPEHTTALLGNGFETRPSS